MLLLVPFSSLSRYELHRGTHNLTDAGRSSLTLDRIWKFIFKLVAKKYITPSKVKLILKTIKFEAQNHQLIFPCPCACVICHPTIRIAVTIQEVRRLSHGQVARDFMSQHHQNRSVLQPLLTFPRAGLEPQEPHHLRGT